SEKQNDFNKLTQIIDEACTEVRNISHQMMPKALQEKGLVDALNDMLEKSLGMTDIKYTFENFNVAGKRFEKHIEIGLFRIAQELVNNIIKHSEAHHVDVQLNLLKSHLILLVVDNGKGFTFDSQKDGIGLMNIKT